MIARINNAVAQAEMTRALNNLAKVANLDADEALLCGAKVVTAAAVRGTPPFAGSRPRLTGSLRANLKGPKHIRVGEEAVERDFRKTHAVIRKPKILKALQGATSDTEKLRLLKRFGYKNIERVSTKPDISYHESFRNQEGRIKGYRSRIAVTDAGAYDAAIEERKADVGKTASGWLPAIRKLKLKVHSKVTRHGSGRGFARFQLGGFTRGKKEITLVNLLPWLTTGRPRLIRLALIAATKSINGRLRRINRARSNKDLAKAKKQARQC